MMMVAAHESLLEIPSRRHLTDITKLLSSVKIVVDKFYMAGHVDPWCLKHCDTNKIPALQKVRYTVNMAHLL